MTLDLANIVGLSGGALMLAAFAYSNLTKSLNLVLFNLLNLLGALMLVASLVVHFNLGSMVLEIAWAAIAFFGLVRALFAQARA
jgi:hypothetical protein